jgi:MarR family transcriptional regulator, lower aerobic nicotinate degradation pathway regulator
MVPRAVPLPTLPRTLPPAMADVTGFLVNRLAEQLRDVTQAHVGGTGLRPRQLGLLLVLRAAGRMQQQQLGEQLGMDRTTTMQLVGALEDQGLVVREANPSDGRAYLLRLTARGVRMAEQVDVQSRAAAAEVLAPLSAAENKTLHRLLRKVLTAPSTTP